MPSQWSTDGNWFWDGQRWNDALSPDGHYRFDGRAWQPYGGQRTPMPPPLVAAAAPVFVAPAAPAPATAVAAAIPAAAYPSWLAADEVHRLEQERVQREQAVRAAAFAPQPQAVAVDWSAVHAQVLRQNARPAVGSWWQVGVGSVVIYLALLMLCFPACGAYVRWGTRWSSSGKLIGYGALAVSWIVLFAIRMSNSG